MRYLVLAVLFVSGCSQAGAEGSSAADSGPPPVPSFDQAALEVVRPAETGDQTLKCIEQVAPNSRRFQEFAILGGEAYSYNSRSNTVEALCRGRKTECAGGWQDGKFAYSFVNFSGGRQTYLVDIDSLTFEQWIDPADAESRYYAGSCEKGEIPEGLSIRF
jgi:hypothetical protein